MAERRDHEVSADQEKQDMLRYMDELPGRLRPFARRAAAVPPNERLSTEWFEELGEWCRTEREAKRINTYSAAAWTGLDVNVVRFWENGLAEPSELDGIRDYVHLISDGSNSTYQTFLEKFGLQKPETPQTLPPSYN